MARCVNRANTGGSGRASRGGMAVRNSRRLFLRGVGGAVVAAPFLASLGQRAARGQGSVDATPRRLIAMFTHHGCMTNRWFPENSHGPLAAADFEGTTLEVLAPHADKILMPRGIRAMNEWTTDVSLGQGNDTHLQVSGSYFTCVPVTPHSDDPFDFDSAKKFNAKPTAPSLDHVCAQQLSLDGLPLFLRVSGRSDNSQSAVSYSGPETPFQGLGDPAQALASILGLSADASPAVTYQDLRERAVVDLVRDDLMALEGYDMSASDRRKLEAWKELLHETTTQVVSALCSNERAATLGLTEQNSLALTEGVGDRLATEISDGMDGADLFSSLAVLAALCDANRVIFLKYPDNYVFTALGLDIETHSMANRTGNAGMGGDCVEGVNDMILTVDRFYADKFAHLIAQLDAVEEGDVTLLDNTATVWFQQMSDGAACNLNNMPLVQAGSCGGFFKTGCAVNVDDGSPDLSRGNSESACAIDGRTEPGNLKATGTPVEFGNAPINKFYCNLMNAIGVRAGSDGFPVVGGTEEVTHYGMYDDTRDFASGGENPPKINDPGQFEDLQA